MKTFEAGGAIAEKGGVESRGVIFFMYVLRALSATLIASLLVYSSARLLGLFYPVLTFPEFILQNLLGAVLLLVFVFIIQALFYFHRLRQGRSLRRGIGELAIGYAIPLAGIAIALYTAYVIGAM